MHAGGRCLLRLRLTISGQDRLAAAFNRLARSIQNYRPAWPDITAVYRQMMQEQFDRQGARGGGKWAPLSPAYKRWKETVAPGQPILVLGGRLKASMVGQTADTIQDYRPLDVTLGTIVPYAKYHQTGTRKMPARPPIVLRPRDIKAMTEVMVNQSAEYGTRAGFRLTRRRLYGRGL